MGVKWWETAKEFSIMTKVMMVGLLVLTGVSMGSWVDSEWRNIKAERAVVAETERVKSLSKEEQMEYVKENKERWWYTPDTYEEQVYDYLSQVHKYFDEFELEELSVEEEFKERTHKKVILKNGKEILVLFDDGFLISSMEMDGTLIEDNIAEKYLVDQYLEQYVEENY